MQKFQNGTGKIYYLDPSEHLRPEPIFAQKPVAKFRDFTIDPADPIKERVRETYLEMHRHQTLSFVQNKMANWTKFDKFEVCKYIAITIIFPTFAPIVRLII